MKTLLLVLAGCFAAGAQQLTISGPNGAVRAGATVTLTVTLTGSSGQNIAALQGSVANPGGTVTCTAGAAAIAAGKTVACGTVGNAVVFLVYGLNQNVLADGVVAQLQVALPLTAAAGNISEGLTGTLGASPAGGAVAITAGSPFGLSAVNACSITGDNPTSLADVLAMIAQIYAGTALQNGLDLNGDGAVDIIDVQRVANAAAPAGTCKVGQ